MAFVAFSRVTTMNGLHLMDFSEGKVWCDLTSLHKYNNLRASIGLEKYAVPKRKKGPVAPEETIRSTTSVPPGASIPLPRVSAPGLRFSFSQTPTTPRRRVRPTDDTEDEGDTMPSKRLKAPQSNTAKRGRISLRKVTKGIGKKLAFDSASDATSANSSPEKNKKMKIAGAGKVKVLIVKTHKILVIVFQNVIVNTAAIIRGAPLPTVTDNVAGNNDASCLVRDGHKVC